MNKITFSICMPTYNFGQFIGETIESILPQLRENVEVVILDSASTDNTAEIVSRYTKKSSNIKYYYQDFKGGIDRDMETSVKLARGEYCWLFSSDDLMREDALAEILDEIESNLDVYLCGFKLYSIDMRKLYGKHPILNFCEKCEFDLKNVSERLAFFKSARTTTAFFSFMSSLIIKKNRWDEVSDVQEFYGSCWAHAARILSLIPNGLKVKYLPDSYLSKRGEHESFLDQGWVHRLAISIDGYHNIADKFFGKNSVEAYQIRRVLKNEIPLSLIYPLRKQVSYEEKGRLDQLVSKLYSDPVFSNWLRLFIYKFAPFYLCKFLWSGYKTVRYLKSYLFS